MQVTINTPNLTPATAKATIEASFLTSQFSYTVNIWSKDSITRVYVNKGRKSIGYVQFANEISAVSDTLTNVKHLTEVLAGDLVEPIKVTKTNAQMESQFDNLQNEGMRDGYNPYRTARTNFSDLARMMAAEGGAR
jgi:hypothetical protein